jgi:hypothetical protein
MLVVPRTHPHPWAASSASGLEHPMSHRPRSSVACGLMFTATEPRSRLSLESYGLPEGVMKRMALALALLVLACGEGAPGPITDSEPPP